MEVTFQTALEAFERLPEASKLPCFDPNYIEIDALRQPGISPIFFLHEEGGELYYHPLHLADVPASSHRDIQSAYGYGGPISTSLDHEFLTAATRAYASWCQERRILAEFIRFHPLAKNWVGYDGEAQYNRETVWIDLEDAPDVGYEQRVRTAIRKSTRQLEVSISPGFSETSEFRKIYEDGMKLIGASDFYFFPEAYFSAFEHYRNGCIVFAKLAGEAVGAAMFLQSGTTVEYHLAASTALGRRYSAANLMIHTAACYWREKGCKRLHLGGGTDEKSDNPLFFFKAGFSPKRGRFFIGSQIHDPNAYEDLKHSWRQQHAAINGRILFYR